jgi:hypothetical protein
MSTRKLIAEQILKSLGSVLKVQQALYHRAAVPMSAYQVNFCAFFKFCASSNFLFSRKCKAMKYALIPVLSHQLCAIQNIFCIYL